MCTKIPLWSGFIFIHLQFYESNINHKFTISGLEKLIINVLSGEISGLDLQGI